jgi:hypothetical protein
LKCYGDDVVDDGKVRTIHSAQENIPRPVALLGWNWAARGTCGIHERSVDWPVTIKSYYTLKGKKKGKNPNSKLATQL